MATKNSVTLARRRTEGSLERRVLRLAENWERKARELGRAAKDSGNQLLAVTADTRLQDVWELRAEVKKTLNDQALRRADKDA